MNTIKPWMPSLDNLGQFHRRILASRILNATDNHTPIRAGGVTYQVPNLELLDYLRGGAHVQN